MKRHELPGLRAEIKTANGRHARTLLLAYAFLRGVPYRVCEPVTMPLPAAALDFFRRQLAHDVVLAVPAPVRVEGVDKATVLAWLAAPEPDARQAKRLASQEAGRARTMAARAAFRARVLEQRAAVA